EVGAHRSEERIARVDVDTDVSEGEGVGPRRHRGRVAADDRGGCGGRGAGARPRAEDQQESDDARQGAERSDSHAGQRSALARARRVPAQSLDAYMYRPACVCLAGIVHCGGTAFAPKTRLTLVNALRRNQSTRYFPPVWRTP